MGRAQEKTAVFRTEKRRDAHGYSVSVDRQDHRAGQPLLLLLPTTTISARSSWCKFCSYFPYNAKLCINGNHWAQRQAAKAGIAVRAVMDNGFAAVDDPAAAAGDLRQPGTGADRRAAAQVAGDPAAPVHRRRPRRRLPLRHLDPAGRVLPDPDARPAGVGAGLLRAGHPRQPRHRPPRPGEPDLRPPLIRQRPASTRPRADSAPG